LNKIDALQTHIFHFTEFTIVVQFQLSNRSLLVPDHVLVLVRQYLLLVVGQQLVDLQLPVRHEVDIVVRQHHHLVPVDTIHPTFHFRPISLNTPVDHKTIHHRRRFEQRHVDAVEALRHHPSDIKIEAKTTIFRLVEELNPMFNTNQLELYSSAISNVTSKNRKFAKSSVDTEKSKKSTSKFLNRLRNELTHSFNTKTWTWRTKLVETWTDDSLARPTAK